MGKESSITDLKNGEVLIHWGKGLNQKQDR